MSDDLLSKIAAARAKTPSKPINDRRSDIQDQLAEIRKKYPNLGDVPHSSPYWDLKNQLRKLDN